MQVFNQAAGVMPAREDIDDGRRIEDLTVLEAAIHMPSQYIQVLAGKKASAVSKKDIGFIMQRSDIHSVRAYVKHANSLPVDYDKIVEWLGFNILGVPELEAVSIQAFHQRVRQHSGTWPALERDTKELSRQMNTFSDKFVTTGVTIIDLINKVNLERFLEGTLDDLTDEEFEELKRLTLNATELTAVAAMKKYIVQVKISTQNYIKHVEAVGALAAEFERVLTDELAPDVKSKLDAYTRTGLSKERQHLSVRIKELDNEIEALIKDYKSHVLYGHSGILLGPIGLAITGGIFGAKAEAIRARKNNSIAERDTAISTLKDQERIATLLDASQLYFTDLQSRMLGAEQGAKQLAQVWGFVLRYLEDAINLLGEIDTFAQLHQFKLDFAQLINPWARVKDYTALISEAFNDILDESR
ncbi:alpha-xenorhabdolysin family binary toxin subunit A [Pseudomonas psychrophila]|uniref:alpha-xenorhabdolysin family binary toxin subunit A n=1 Tax=Pseudomonas psychrophila TaxID=122355 RepID=UPI0002FBCEBE|nr:alpha-xenorhabdolysin family binary toxin subunit A [Pseudomonas psychrophila]